MTGELFHNEKHAALDAILPGMIERYQAKHGGARPAAAIVHTAQHPGVDTLCGVEVDSMEQIQQWHVWLVGEEK